MRKTRRQIEKIINRYRKSLQNFGINIERIILYGSFAGRRQSEHSDIDLIVVAKDFEKMNLRKRLEVLGIAAARIMEPVEALGYTPKEIVKAGKRSFLKEILEYGINV